VLTLADYAIKSRITIAGRPAKPPNDSEWAKDAHGKIYIAGQTRDRRPQVKGHMLEEYTLKGSSTVR
jgi:hypothetical protein